MEGGRWLLRPCEYCDYFPWIHIGVLDYALVDAFVFLSSIPLMFSLLFED